MIKKYLPTFYCYASKLWQSPTFTTWGNYAADSIRLIVVTPLLITNFDPTEIAAWYLFASLLFFGDVITSRISLTFSRMIAFAMAGVDNLAPIKDGKKYSVANEEPNWGLVERTYKTTGGLLSIVALVAAITATLLGVYGLGGILADYHDPGLVWSAFIVMIVSNMIAVAFKKYQVALRGMNYVSLSNRWNILFSLLSAICGALALSLGANIFELSLTMQTVQLLGLFRYKLILYNVEGKCYTGYKAWGFDLQVVKWAWEPFYKGVIMNVINSGVIQIASVVFARHYPAETVASYLFTLRMLQVAKKISDAPFHSVTPRMSRLRASGQNVKLINLLLQRTTYAQLLMIVPVILMTLFGNHILTFIGSDVKLLEVRELWILGAFMFFQNYQLLTIVSSAVGNHIVCFERAVVSFIVSVVLVISVVPEFGVYGLIAAVLLPPLIIINVKPIGILGQNLGIGTYAYISKSLGLPILAALILSLPLLFK